MGETEILTTAQGEPVADDQNTLTIGERGPGLIPGRGPTGTFPQGAA